MAFASHRVSPTTTTSQSHPTQPQGDPVTAGTAKLHQHEDGRICARSSDGVNRYAVTLGADPACTCKGFTYHGYCYHLDAAVARYAGASFAPFAVIVPDSQPEPPTPAAPAVCGECGSPLDGFGGCPCDGRWNSAA
jgi:hypothetical protein